MAHGMVQVLLLSIQLVEGLLRVNHKLLKLDLLEFLFLDNELTLHFIKLLSHAFHLFISVLLHFLLLCLEQLIDLELTIKFFLHFFEHKSHLSHVTLHLVVLDLHLG